MVWFRFGKGCAISLIVVVLGDWYNLGGVSEEGKEKAVARGVE